MSSVQTIFAGDTSDVWEVGLVTTPPGTRPPRYEPRVPAFTCWLAVEGAAPPIAREITAKDVMNTKFLAWLTPAESLALGTGSWRVGIELRNPAMVPPLVREAHAVVRIVAGLVPPA